MNLCPECHHAPSGRTFACECCCHDVADAGPELLEACKLIARWGIRRSLKPAYRIVTKKLADAIAKAEGGAK